MIVLGIETSCDETAAALVEDGTKILSSVVASQDKIHGRFGGVVPELASRSHVTTVLPVIEEALVRANLKLSEVDAIAVTRGPGLIGALLVGLSAGKAIAYARGIPLVGVHHIEGHLSAALLSGEPVYPLVGLVASGGHTDLYLLNAPRSYRLLGRSLDDAAGEAFDKVAKILHLGYPGGPAIDQVSEGGNPKAVAFPKPAVKGNDFSFSGLKTAVAFKIHREGMPKSKSELSDIAASFQEVVVHTLSDRLFRAAEEANAKSIAVCGGVARNRRLRAVITDEAKERGLKLSIPPLDLCTDNAAMIAACGFDRLTRGEKDDLFLNATATLDIHGLLS